MDIMVSPAGVIYTHLYEFGNSKAFELNSEHRFLKAISQVANRIYAVYSCDLHGEFCLYVNWYELKATLVFTDSKTRRAGETVVMTISYGGIYRANVSELTSVVRCFHESCEVETTPESFAGVMFSCIESRISFRKNLKFWEV